MIPFRSRFIIGLEVTTLNYNQAVNYILDIPKFGVKAGLENIRVLLELLGNPQKHLKIIHVAGTNGKGSVCSMLSSILCANGYRTGLFTSPHLMKINERLKINQDDISDDAFCEVFHEVYEKMQEMVAKGYNHPTFFEVLVAMALLYFKKEQVEYAILETGVGGRLDSTNVIEDPVLTIITPIGLDHVAVLGDTIEAIAKEKVGIIKAGRPTVLYYDKQTVFDVVSNVCRQKKSKLYSYDQFEHHILKITKKNIDFSINNKYYKYEKVYLQTIASYQLINVSIALTAVEALIDCGISLSKEKVLQGLATFKWPGRMELLTDHILIDGAHNALGMRMFAHEINTFYKDREVTILFASMKDKPYTDMIKELKKCHNINKVILTQIESDRAASVNQLRDVFEREGFLDIECIERIDQAVAYVRRLSQEGSMMCCIGSLYLVGYVKSQLEEEDCT